MFPPYLILPKRNQILNMSNPVAYISDNNGSKCKIMYRFKISAMAGLLAMTSGANIDYNMLHLFREPGGNDDFLRDDFSKHQRFQRYPRHHPSCGCSDRSFWNQERIGH